jgi:hypothetical protein
MSDDWRTVERYEVDGVPIHIWIDDDMPNPYKWSEKASELLISKRLAREYDLGDDAPMPGQNRSWYYDGYEHGAPSSEVMCRWLTMFGGYVLALPFDHADYGSGGVRVWLTQPDDEPASGYVVMTKEQYDSNFGNYNIPVWGKGPEDPSAELCARIEFNEFRSYMEGEVYGWTAGEDGDDMDSCGGYYGELEYVKSQAEEAAKAIAHDRHVNTDPPDIAEVLADAR